MFSCPIWILSTCYPASQCLAGSGVKVRQVCGLETIHVVIVLGEIQTQKRLLCFICLQMSLVAQPCFTSLSAQHLLEHQVAHKPMPGGLRSRCCVENGKDNKNNLSKRLKYFFLHQAFPNALPCLKINNNKEGDQEREGENENAKKLKVGLKPGHGTKHNTGRMKIGSNNFLKPNHFETSLNFFLTSD